MRARLAILAVSLLAPAAAWSAPTLEPKAVAKTCSAGYVHASLRWGHKCLRHGQFCKISADREYHRHRFHCHTGRLT